MIAESTAATDTEFGSYGLDQCIDLVEAAMKRGNGVKRPPGTDWLEGQRHGDLHARLGAADRASFGGAARPRR